MTQKVIQFIGTQRSGSNLLRLMLNQHRGISAPHPPHILKTFMPLISRYGDLKVRKNRFLLVDDVCHWVECNPVEWSLVNFDRDEITDKITSLLDLFEVIYQQKCTVDKAEMWCCKSTFNIHYTGELEKVIRPFYIYLYRDGRDVATSFKEAYVGPKHIYQIAQKWQQEQKETALFLSKLSSHRFVQISYEALIQDPEKTLRMICENVGVEFDDIMLDYFNSKESLLTSKSGNMWANVAKPIITNNSQKFYKLLTTEEIEIFESIAAKSLLALRYKLMTSGDPIQWSEKEIQFFGRKNQQLLDDLQKSASQKERLNRAGQKELLKSITQRNFKV